MITLIFSISLYRQCYIQARLFGESPEEINMVLERIRSIKKANSLLERERITWVQCQFTDISGRIRSFTCPSSDFINGRLWKEGMTFDGSSVAGWKGIKKFN